MTVREANIILAIRDYCEEEKRPDNRYDLDIVEEEFKKAVDEILRRQGWRNYHKVGR